MTKVSKSAVRFKLLDAYSEIAYVVTDSGRLPNSPFGNMSLSPNGQGPDSISNREAAAQTLGLELAQCVFMQQRHTSHIAYVNQMHAGNGAYRYDSAIKATDGITTDTPNLGLFSLAADCQSILLYAPDVHAVAAIHCGWRGTLQNMPQAAVTAMQNFYRARPDLLLACLAPCIGPKAFEVRDDVAELFRSSHPSIPLLEHPEPGKYYINLPEANRQLLLNADLLPERIETQHICTYSTWPRFFSARRGDNGRFAAGIAIKKND